MKNVATFVLAAVGAVAAGQVPTLLYMPGRTIKDQKITLRSWGSGTVAETDEVAFEGTTSIRVSTRNYFQGGIITFTEPKDLAEKFDDKNNLLRFTFLLADQNMRLGTAPRGPGGAPPRGAQAASTAQKGVKSLRLIVTTTDFKRSEIYVPIGTSMTMDRGWKSVAVPLPAITGLDRTNKIIKEIAVSTDNLAILYIGDIRVVRDDTPITGEMSEQSLNLALGDPRVLVANGFGGSSVLVYEWDFDDRDGIQVDMEGQAVQRKFRKAGSFKVTLTIRDLYNLKTPFRTSIPVKVNP